MRSPVQTIRRALERIGFGSVLQDLDNQRTVMAAEGH
jgi:hypothetical protein